MFPGNSPCFSWLNKETLWPLRYLETFSPQITKKVDKQHPFFDSVQTLMNQIFAEHAARRRRSTIKSVKTLCCFSTMNQILVVQVLFWSSDWVWL